MHDRDRPEVLSDFVKLYGYHDGVAGLSRDTGVSRGTMNVWFKTKPKLLRLLIIGTVVDNMSRRNYA